jgi:hypothetical protein
MNWKPGKRLVAEYAIVVLLVIVVFSIVLVLLRPELDEFVCNFELLSKTRFCLQ